MPTSDPHDDASPGLPGMAEPAAAGPDRPEPAGTPAGNAPEKRRNPWIWISALLALVAVGVTIWALTVESDLDSAERAQADAQQQLDSAEQELDATTEQLDTTQQELDATKQDVGELQSQADEGDNTGRAFVTAKALYDEFAEQLGATQDDLEATQQGLEAAEKAAKQAEEDAAAAKQEADDATDETDKAKAQADQAQAEARAARSKAAIAADCAKAYISAFGGLFEGGSAREQAPVVREELSDITAACKAELAGA